MIARLNISEQNREKKKMTVEMEIDDSLTALDTGKAKDYSSSSHNQLQSSSSASSSSLNSTRSEENLPWFVLCVFVVHFDWTNVSSIFV